VSQGRCDSKNFTIPIFELCTATVRFALDSHLTGGLTIYVKTLTADESLRPRKLPHPQLSPLSEAYVNLQQG
jgi:hypothetical protein